MSYLEIDPARAKSKSADDLWEDSEWVAEEKLDGWRFLMHFGGDLPRVFLTGRRQSKTTGKLSEKGLCAPDIWPYSDCASLGYTVLDGEVMSPAGFRDIAGIMNVSPGKAAKRIAEIGPPTYRVFDILFNDGLDVRHYSWIERQQVLAQIWNALGNPLITRVGSSPDRLCTYDRIVESGGEGVILKNIFSPYGEGWVKVKRYSTLDVVITGFTDAKMGKTGKYLGLIGAALVSVYGAKGDLLEVGRVSGMTDDVRRDMSQNPTKWFGTVIEVAAQEFGKERLRHPRFKRARPDADPKHATFAKMMADLKVSGRNEGVQLGFGF
jgi:ATP-dependent DNA ligase